MFLPSLALLTTSLLTLAHAANPHHNPPARRAHHFGNPNTPLNARQDPPVGTKVYTTKIERSGNVTTTEEEAGDYVKRGSGVVDLGERGLPVGKRAFSGMRATYYAIGMGACGQYDAEPAYIVALNSAQYGGGYPGPECFKSITITGGSRNGHAVATIKDECPTCPYGGLDMSEALFSNFASADEGVATITWWYNDDAPAAPAPAPTTSSTPAYTPPAPTTSSTPAWTPEPSTSTTPAYTPPTSTWVAPTTSSSVYTPPPTSTTPTSTWVAPTTSSTPTPSSTSVWSSSSVSSSTLSSSAVVSSTIASSSSVIPTSRSSIAVGKSETASTTLSASSSSAALPTGTAKVVPAAPVQTSAGNLQLLSEVTLQLGNMIVLSAQQV